jgi:translation elongation factor EF-1alpha
MTEKEIGEVSGYFSKIGVVAIKLSGELKIKDKIKIKGNTTNFEVDVKEMQIEKGSIKIAKPGDHIGIKVPEKARFHDKVFLIK